MLPLVTTVEAPEPSGTRRERNRRRVREAILDSALELFSSRGFDAVTVSEVADRAEVSAATVARYFPTKESMLFPERDVNVARLRIAVLGRPARESPWRALVEALTSQPPMPDDARDRLLQSRRAIARSNVLRGRAIELLGAWRDGIADALVERGDVEPRDARAIATAAVALLDDAAATWAATGGTTDLAAEVSAAFAAFERARRRA